MNKASASRPRRRSPRRRSSLQLVGLFLSDPGQQISPRAMEQADAARRLQKGNNICFGDLFRADLGASWELILGLPEPHFGPPGAPLGPVRASWERARAAGAVRRGQKRLLRASWAENQKIVTVQKIVRTGPERSWTRPSSRFWRIWASKTAPRDPHDGLRDPPEASPEGVLEH